jgi:polar amino acid transport system permease protein
MIDLIREHGPYLLVSEYPKGPLGGLALTLILALTAMALVFPCAVLVALARTSAIRMLVWTAAAFVSFVRTVPVLLIIFWTYLAAPIVLGFPVSGFTTIVISITIYQTAYLSEVVRAGIEALPKGQVEAGRALGLGYVPITLRIVLPQVLVNVSPGILNVLTIIVKETSLGYMVGVGELTLTASHVNSLTLTKPLEIFALLSLMYFAICFGIGLAVKWLERRVGVAVPA